MPLVSDLAANLTFWTPVGIAVIVLIGSIVRQHLKDRDDDR